MPDANNLPPPYGVSLRLMTIKKAPVSTGASFYTIICC